jgi:hypothetical protein
VLVNLKILTLFHSRQVVILARSMNLSCTVPLALVQQLEFCCLNFFIPRMVGDGVSVVRVVRVVLPNDRKEEGSSKFV